MESPNRIMALIAVVFLFFAAQGKAAETDDSVYLQIDYIKSAKNQATDFQQNQKERWLPIHQQRVDQEAINNWSIYEVLVAEPEADYNYVAITVVDDFSNLYSTYSSEMINAVYPNQDIHEIMGELKSAHEVVNSEVWHIEGSTHPEEKGQNIGKYITKNYMDARGGSGEHRSMELDFWLPVHHVRVGKDILNSWEMYSLVKPSGDATRYTYSTIDYYERLSDIEGSVGMELARVAHPDEDDSVLQDFFSRTGQSRSVYKTELWRLLETTLEVQ